MSNVILLNPFDVRPEQVEDALAYWDEAAAIMRAAPGFVSTQLHQALAPDTRFQLINRAEWTSPDAFQAAITSKPFTEMVRRNEGRFQYYPGLYRIVRT